MLAARRALGSALAWPQLPALSPASFVDHFDAGSLDTTKWTAVTSGTGAVSLTDSYCDLNAPASNAAFIYRQVDITKSQLWTMCVARNLISGTAGSGVMRLLNGAAAPTADTTANIDAKTLCRHGIALQSSLAILDAYFSSAGTITFWTGPSGPWTTTFASSLNSSMPVQNGDYYVLGIEVDGVNSRWRMLVWGQAFATAGTWTFNQGWRLFALTDWVTWANTRDSSSGVWLVIGQPYTDQATGYDYNVEWVRYGEAQPGNKVIDGWNGGKLNLAAVHRIRHVYSHDGNIFVPQDRASWALDLGGASPDDLEVESPSVVYDGASTDWMYYHARGSTVATSICVASAAHVAAGTGQNTVGWTRSGSNPLITVGASGNFDDSQIRYPFVLQDAGGTWHILYAGIKVADGFNRIGWATASAPQGPFTKQGVIIDVGTTGANDAGGALNPTPVRYQGLWYVFYSGVDASGQEHLMWAKGATFGTLVKQGTLWTPDNVSQALTANLTAAPGRTVTVASTTGYRKDAPVILSQSTNSDTWSSSRVRKIVNSTTLELYHGLTGFTTTYPARIRQVTSSPNFAIRAIARGADGMWRFFITPWEPFVNTAESATYVALYEENALLTHSAADPAGATPTVQDLPYVTSRGFNSDSESYENFCLLSSPATA